MSVKAKITAVFLIIAMFSGIISGCGGGTGEGTDNTMGNSSIESNTGNSQDGSQWAEGTPMGRYVEETVEFPNGIKLSGSGSSLYKLEDGTLIIVDSGGSMLESRDNGKNWREAKKPWFAKLMANDGYIMSVSVSSDNIVAAVWAESMEKDSGEEDLDTQLLVFKSDGTEITADVELTEEDLWIASAYVADTGRIFAGTLSSNIYEIKEDGSSEKFITAEDGHPELIQFYDDLMFMDGWGYDSLLIYDMDTDEYIEDEVLEEFIEKNYKGRNSYSGGYYDMFFLPDNDNVIYIAGDKGLYRHVLGGSVMEQIIDGNLSTFGNPAYSIAGMVLLEDNEFLVLFTEGKLVRFTYNPDIPTVPTGKVKVYSLQENATIRQAISLYQTANPAVYVEYEIGMGESNSITREDALKSLNTKVMAGDGPDVLVLDNMPVDSYIEKGLLMDISPILDGMSGEDELFGNMVDAFRKEGKIYAMPCEVQMPFILGRGKDVTMMKDLEGIADGMETLRKNNPGANLVEIASEKGIMRMFSMVSAPAWRTEKGEIDKAAIAEFLIQTKRIYDAQMDGLPEQDVWEWNETSEYYVRTLGESMEDSDDIRMYEGDVQFAGDLRKLAMGSLLNAEEYARQISIPTMEGFEDCEIIPMNGQCSNVFWARTLIGINEASKEPAQAEDFVRTVFGKENQMNLLGGMAVNKAALLGDFENRKNKSNDNIYGSFTLSNDDGLYVHIVIRVPEEEEVNDLVTWMESATTAYVEDDTFENAVYEEGIAYMQGAQSLEDAVDQIEKKLAIYLAE